MSAMSVVFSVFVLNFHHKTTAARPPPAWIKGVATIASYVTCSEVHFSDACGSETAGEYKLGSHSYSDPINSQHVIGECQMNNFEEGDANQRLLQRPAESLGTRCNTGSCNGTVIIPDRQTSDKTVTLLEKVMLDYVTKVLSSYDKKSHETRTIQDWREIARVIDRLFFALFLFITLVSTFVILIVCPVMKNITIDSEILKDSSS